MATITPSPKSTPDGAGETPEPKHQTRPLGRQTGHVILWSVKSGHGGYHNLMLEGRSVTALKGRGVKPGDRIQLLGNLMPQETEEPC